MDEKRAKDNLILKLSFKFSLNIMEFNEQLEGLKKFVTAKQILLSGISVGALSREAQNAESKADFFTQTKNCSKRS